MRYAGVKLPVRILKPPMRVVRTIITITFILFPSFVVIAETIVSNTPASVSIWKYRNANKSINPADFIMEASCSTMKVLVSSMECPRISAQRTGAMKRTKLNGSFFVMTVATTMRIKINAMIKVAFINKSFLLL